MQVGEAYCDVLIPAALEGQIHHGNAARIKARVVAEAANGPVDFDAEAILRERGTLILSDIYLNAGGVTVSYFEWLKNRAGVSFDRMLSRHEELVKQELIEQMEALVGSKLTDGGRRRIIQGPKEEELVRAALEHTMLTSYSKLRTFWKERDLPSLRVACYLMSMTRVAESYRQHGIFP